MKQPLCIGLLLTTFLPAHAAGNKLYYGIDLGYQLDTVHYDINEFDYINYASENGKVGFLMGYPILKRAEYELDLELTQQTNDNQNFFLNSQTNQVKLAHDPSTIINMTLTVPWQDSLNIFSSLGYQFSKSSIINTRTMDQSQHNTESLTAGLGIDLHLQPDWSYRVEYSVIPNTSIKHWSNKASKASLQIMHHYAPGTKIARASNKHKGFLYPLLTADQSNINFKKNSHTTNSRFVQTNQYRATDPGVTIGLGYTTPNYKHFRLAAQVESSMGKNTSTLTNIYAPVTLSKSSDVGFAFLPEWIINSKVKVFSKLGYHQTKWKMQYAQQQGRFESPSTDLGAGVEIGYNEHVSYRLSLESRDFKPFKATLLGDNNSFFAPSAIKSTIGLLYHA